MLDASEGTQQMNGTAASQAPTDQDITQKWAQKGEGWMALADSRALEELMQGIKEWYKKKGGS